MLKKEFRLLGPLPSQARSFQTPLFNIKIAKDTKGNKKFGFIVSKKIDRRAVVRNQVKRKLRSVIEDHIESIKPGYDFLFIIKKNALGKDKEELEKILLEKLKKENIYA